MKKEIRLITSLGSRHSQILIDEKQMEILENKKLKVKIKKVNILYNNKYQLVVDIFNKGKSFLKNVELLFENKDILYYVESDSIEKIKIKTEKYEDVPGRKCLRTEFVFKIKN